MVLAGAIILSFYRCRLGASQRRGRGRCPREELHKLISYGSSPQPVYAPLGGDNDLSGFEKLLAIQSIGLPGLSLRPVPDCRAPCARPKSQPEPLFFS